MKLITLFTLLFWVNFSSADTELSIVTPKGYVSFIAADHWPVLEMQTQMPATLTVFKLPNPADEGTSDSSNLILQLFERGSEKEKTLFSAPVKQYGSSPPVTEQFKEWTITRQEDPQNKTVYSLWDARKTGIADVSVRVRLVWPHLTNNPANYEEQMEKIFVKFLMSIRDGVGKYKRKVGDVIRGPNGAQLIKESEYLKIFNQTPGSDPS